MTNKPHSEACGSLHHVGPRIERNTVPLGLVVIFATALVLSMVAPARAEASPCSFARTAASWIFTDTGTVFIPPSHTAVPRDAFGKFTLNATGSLLNGVATSSLNGTVAEETFYGTYTVNPDCTGTISIQVFSAATELFAVTLNIIFDEKMEHINGIFTSVLPPGSTTSLPTVIAVEARRQ